MANVGVVFGGRSVEHQVSIASARTVARALREAGHGVTPLGIAQDGCWLCREDSAAALAEGEVRAIPAVGAPVAPTLAALLTAGVEVGFPIVHGSGGEDGRFHGLSHMPPLPYPLPARPPHP